MARLDRAIGSNAMDRVMARSSRAMTTERGMSILASRFRAHRHTNPPRYTEHQLPCSRPGACQAQHRVGGEHPDHIGLTLAPGFREQLPEVSFRRVERGAG